MDRFEIHMITINISIIARGYINNRKVMQGLENIYYKKLRYKHHHKNFEGGYTKNRESVEDHLILWSNGIQFEKYREALG